MIQTKQTLTRTTQKVLGKAWQTRSKQQIIQTGVSMLHGDSKCKTHPQKYRWKPTGKGGRPTPLIEYVYAINSDNEDKDEVNRDRGNGQYSNKLMLEDKIFHPETMTPYVQRVYGMIHQQNMQYNHLFTMAVHHKITQ